MSHLAGWGQEDRMTGKLPMGQKELLRGKMREPKEAELAKGITEPKSHFGKACEKLGGEGYGSHQAG
jgi:hypothetical protein